MGNLGLPASPTGTFHAFSSTITHIWKWDIQNDRRQKFSSHHEMTGCTFSILQISSGSRRKLFHLMICLFFDHSCTSGQYCDSSLLYVAVSILFLTDLFIFASTERIDFQSCSFFSSLSGVGPVLSLNQSTVQPTDIIPQLIPPKRKAENMNCCPQLLYSSLETPP